MEHLILGEKLLKSYFFNLLTVYFCCVRYYYIRPSIFYFLFYRFFRNKLGSEDEKNKNKIHSDHFPIELKSKIFVFPSILIKLENGPNDFYLYFAN